MDKEIWGVIKFLRTVDGWSMSNKKDVKLISTLKEEFPRVDLMSVARKYKKKNNGDVGNNFRLQFRNWVKNQSKWLHERINEDMKDAVPKGEGTDDVPDWRKELGLGS